jgi:hypothetical protein
LRTRHNAEALQAPFTYMLALSRSPPAFASQIPSSSILATCNVRLPGRTRLANKWGGKSNTNAKDMSDTARDFPQACTIQNMCFCCGHRFRTKLNTRKTVFAQTRRQIIVSWPICAPRCCKCCPHGRGNPPPFQYLPSPSPSADRIWGREESSTMFSARLRPRCENN